MKQHMRYHSFKSLFNKAQRSSLHHLTDESDRSHQKCDKSSWYMYLKTKQMGYLHKFTHTLIIFFFHSAMRLSQRRSALWWADGIAPKYQQRRRAGHTWNMKGVRGLRFHLVTNTSARCSFPLNIWHRTRIGTFGGCALIQPTTKLIDGQVLLQFS